MHGNRAASVACGVLVLAVAAFLLRQHGPSGVPWLPSCLLHDLTGLNCPGCGMTRAAHATLQGRLGDAFRYNPVGMILLPVASVGLGIEAINWVREKPLPFRMKLGARGAWVLAGIVISFGILRNIPVWPLTLLAPP